MLDTFPYEVYHPEAESKPPRFETLREAYAKMREWNQDFPGHVVRRRYPKNCQKTLQTLLEEKGLGHLRVWYHPSHPCGWMINDGPGDDGMQRLGYNFRQAIEMLRGQTIDYMYKGGRPSVSEKT